MRYVVKNRAGNRRNSETARLMAELRTARRELNAERRKRKQTAASA